MGIVVGILWVGDGEGTERCRYDTLNAVGSLSSVS